MTLAMTCREAETVWVKVMSDSEAVAEALYTVTSIDFSVTDIVLAFCFVLLK